jgi:hypothetical protein
LNNRAYIVVLLPTGQNKMVKRNWTNDEEQEKLRLGDGNRNRPTACGSGMTNNLPQTKGAFHRLRVNLRISSDEAILLPIFYSVPLFSLHSPAQSCYGTSTSAPYNTPEFQYFPMYRAQNLWQATIHAIIFNLPPWHQRPKYKCISTNAFLTLTIVSPFKKKSLLV